jgi:uncharacterized membrane protein YfcA
MNLAGLIPADLSTSAAIAICAIAFVSGTARGFSGFGSALIFMPLAAVWLRCCGWSQHFCSSSISWRRRRCFPNAWKQANRKSTAVMVAGALIGVPVGTYFS